MQALASSGVLWILLFGVLVGLFFLPTLIGLIRGVDRLALVFLVNLVAGPFFVGWPAAMILAFGPRRLPPEPAWLQHPGEMPESAGTWMPGPWDQR